MKESKILKIFCYILIPILILVILFSVFYELCKKEYTEKDISNKEYFKTDSFLSNYMNILSSETTNLIFSHDNYKSIQDGDYEICYEKSLYNIKDLYYIIFYEKFAITNVELTAETNSVEKIKNFIENKSSKKANIINGIVDADSELIENKAIQYFDNFKNKYYTIKDNEENQYNEMGQDEEYIYLQEYGDILYKQWHDTSIKDLQIFTSYKEEIVKSEIDIFLTNLINELSPYEDVLLYSIPISTILLCIISIYLIISIGHTKGKEEIDINDFDKVPIEIILIVDCIVVSLVFIFIDNIRFENSYSFLISLVLTSFFLIYIVCFLTVVTIIKRIKAKILLKECIVIKIFKWCFGIIKIIWKKIKEIFNKVKKDFDNIKSLWPYEIKIILFIVCLFFMALGVIIIFKELGLFIDIVIFGFLLYEFLIDVGCYLKIENHLKEMYNGEHTKKINSKEFPKKFQNVVKYINDISTGFENAIDEGIKSERLKTELITNVSHDIKTPLTSIINYVDLLKDEKIDNSKAKEYINVLENKSQRLKKLTEDLIEASKASSGNVKLNIEEININELIKQTTGEFEDKFKEKNLNIICTIPKEILYINADNRYMYRIIENLFSNISKYALDNSRVYIDVKKEFGKVKIEIKNISQDKLNISVDELMQRFVRGDKARTTEGSGLGISISKSLTEIQNGKFELQIDGDLFKVQLEFDLLK